DLEGFLQTRIKAPLSRTFNGSLAHGSAGAGRRVLKNDSARRVRDRINAALSPQAVQRCHLGALRIVHDVVSALRVVVPGCTRIVFDAADILGEGTDDACRSISVEIALGPEACGLS